MRPPINDIREFAEQCDGHPNYVTNEAVRMLNSLVKYVRELERHILETEGMARRGAVLTVHHEDMTLLEFSDIDVERAVQVRDMIRNFKQTNPDIWECLS